MDGAVAGCPDASPSPGHPDTHAPFPHHIDEATLAVGPCVLVLTRGVRKFVLTTLNRHPRLPPHTDKLLRDDGLVAAAAGQHQRHTPCGGLSCPPEPRHAAQEEGERGGRGSLDAYCHVRTTLSVAW